MSSQTLREARKYEEALAKLISKEDRPGFHLSPRVGWMNDPNGFSYYNGKYHMFYQYYPYEAAWGPMHWGHAVSDDLLHWEHLTCALAPDEFYDKDGVFSGSAIGLPDGRQLLIYTGVMKRTVENGHLKEFQTQCLAMGDGVDYEKYANNPVLGTDAIPANGNVEHFRDPKIWQKKDGSYRLLVANLKDDGFGQLLLFKSKNALNWEFEKVFAENDGSYGLMWECPDFFELDGQGVIFVSPQDMLPEGFEFHNGNGNVCLIGDYDDATDTFVTKSAQAVDYGIDFYAHQSILTPDGRRVMIGWMQNWDTSGAHDRNLPWFGQMTVPRELEIKNGRLYQNPIRELESMRKDKVEHLNTVIKGDESVLDTEGHNPSSRVYLDGIEGRQIDMTITIHPENVEDIYDKFTIGLASDSNKHTDVIFRPKENIVKLDRKFSGSRRSIVHQRRTKVPFNNGEVKVRIILDRFSMELFFEDGAYAMTATLDTEVSAQQIYFEANKNVVIDVTKYDLSDNQ